MLFMFSLLRLQVLYPAPRGAHDIVHLSPAVWWRSFHRLCSRAGDGVKYVGLDPSNDLTEGKKQIIT